MEVNKSNFIVTGGASGLGKAVVSLLLEKGAYVSVFDRNAEAGDDLQKRYPSQLQLLNVDVTNEEQVGEAVKKSKDSYGPIDGAINCAGVAYAEKTVGKEGEAHNLKIFEKTMRVNVVGTFNVCRLVAQAIADSTNDKDKEQMGVLVNTASIAAYDGQLGQVAYAASKGAIASMTLPMARDLSGLKIRVACIAPGIFDTPMLQALPDKVRNALGAMVPHPARLGRADEFAALAIHIIENDMINGEVIRLDGGLRMPPK
jgi:NAD(P)-dependent dehydrogenase (short-subunit alcohol dehydrogenase family)